jgi:hypothetical protein
MLSADAGCDYTPPAAFFGPFWYVKFVIAVATSNGRLS